MNEPNPSRTKPDSPPEWLLAGEEILNKTRRFTQAVDERVRIALHAAGKATPHANDPNDVARS
jgi:hypothetical protein